jgi:hypothetical protein
MEVPQTRLSTHLCGSYQPRMQQSNPNFPKNPLKIYDLNKLIFSYLDPVSLALASRVCKVWHTIANENELWKAFVVRHQLWSDGNVKRNVLQQFGTYHAFVITKNKNHLFIQVIDYFAQQHWNQAASFSCRLGPKFDDRIFFSVKRNPLCPAGDHFIPLNTQDTRFFSDSGPAQPDPLHLPPVELETLFSEQAHGVGLQEYFISMPCPVESHQGSYEAQILMPLSVSSVYLNHFKTLAKHQLAKLAKEEKSLKTRETISRALIVGYALEERGMYGNVTESSSFTRLKDKGGIVSVSI